MNSPAVNPAVNPTGKLIGILFAAIFFSLTLLSFVPALSVRKTPSQILSEYRNFKGISVSPVAADSDSSSAASAPSDSVRGSQSVPGKSAPRKSLQSRKLISNRRSLVYPDPVKPVIAVFPLFNTSSSETAPWKVWGGICDFFRKRGFAPLEREKIIRAMESGRIFPNVRQTDDRFIKVAAELGADLALTGSLRKFGTDRRFRIGAIATGGVVLYGSVELDIRVHLVKTSEVFWERTVSWTKKRQIAGFIQASSGAVDEALERALSEVLEPFVDYVILRGLPDIGDGLKSGVSSGQSAGSSISADGGGSQ
ncbi:MAG: hypothetical protein CVV64_19055 [Candidatus Wallbacteria bacterium HGW-Wallbacteria-1]|uniref:Uncharacterized protein n=1 Tax=Candidatus Wallbacteria bacterium HGW-Wallbacteria-1 TaxID=2013854 RepID=A0A2N1PJ89_9BACT|nr:MAG: hypothetical protein CVV64_19055 [Candidatus Wallbacteria bacterium HGW-Wallbacteria-1]